MSRPVAVDLTVPHERWRDIPMPASNAPMRLVRLEAPPDTFAIYSRFPAGFERATPGGYDVSEEFLVLDGELILDDLVLRRGDLTYLPTRTVRRGMRAEQDCTVLAWFDGPADFRPVDELAELGPEEPGGRRTVPVLDAAPGELLDVPPARWSVTEGSVDPADDVIDLGLRTWSRGAPVGGTGPFLVRTAT